MREKYVDMREIYSFSLFFSFFVLGRGGGFGGWGGFFQSSKHRLVHVHRVCYLKYAGECVSWCVCVPMVFVV